MIIALCHFLPRMPSESHSASSSAALVLNAVFPSELFYSPGGVDKFLFAGKERVAIGADFDAHHVALDGRAGFEGVAAGAVHSDGVIVGVNTGFHGSPNVAAGLRSLPGRAGDLQARRLVARQT